MRLLTGRGRLFRLHVERRQIRIGVGVGARVQALELSQLVCRVNTNLAADPIRLKPRKHVAAHQQVGVKLNFMIAPPDFGKQTALRFDAAGENSPPTTSPAQGVIWRGRSRCDEDLGEFVAKAMLPAPSGGKLKNFI
jgi:hypothetical protein